MSIQAMPALPLAILILLTGGPTLSAQQCCLCGAKVCVLEVSREEEDVRYFDVEPKDICIPGICLPWSKCGKRWGGGVRRVCVLVAKQRPQQVCKYDWSVKTICHTCCHHHGLACIPEDGQLCQDERIPHAYATAPREGPPPANASERSDGESRLPGVQPPGLSPPSMVRDTIAGAGPGATGSAPPLLHTPPPVNLQPGASSNPHPLGLRVIRQLHLPESTARLIE